jgi:hypothetical protein
MNNIERFLLEPMTEEELRNYVPPTEEEIKAILDRAQEVRDRAYEVLSIPPTSSNTRYL